MSRLCPSTSALDDRNPIEYCMKELASWITQAESVYLVQILDFSILFQIIYYFLMLFSYEISDHLTSNN